MVQILRPPIPKRLALQNRIQALGLKDIANNHADMWARPYIAPWIDRDVSESGHAAIRAVRLKTVRDRRAELDHARFGYRPVPFNFLYGKPEFGRVRL